MKNILFVFFPAQIKRLVLETQHLRIIFEVWDPDPIFPEHIPKTRIFHGLGAARHSEADPADEPDEADEGKMVHDRQFGP